VSLDYFVASGDYAGKFTEAYPDKPNKIQIIFLSDDDFQSCYEEWDCRDGSGKRLGYGDGETFYLWDAGKEDYIQETVRARVDEFTKAHKGIWKPVLTLNFIIPKIRGVFGMWQFKTSGDRSSIHAIRETFDMVKEQAGTIVNIPFDLTVKKVKSNKPEDKRNYPVVNLIPNVSSENIELLKNFLQQGIDVKHIGMLTDEKVSRIALNEHTIDVEATDVTDGERGNDKA